MENRLILASESPRRYELLKQVGLDFDHFILGKPKSREEAKKMLRRLSGKGHRVLTGFSVHHLEKGKGDREAVQTAVKVKKLTPAEMEWYVETGEPFDKAGGYAVQGIGSFMIESIKGSYTNVVGLPICELVQMLRRLGAITFPPTLSLPH